VPAITQGIISRPREWAGGDLTLLQVDATIRGGQSGGVLVSDLGQVVGISNRGNFAGNTGLINEISDLAEFIEDLERGRNPDGIGNRILLSELGGSTSYSDLQLANFRDKRAFIIRPNAGDTVSLSATSDDTTLLMEVVEVNSGFEVFASASPYTNNTSTSFTLTRSGNFIVTITSRLNGERSFDFSSSHIATPVQIDADDGRRLSVGSSRIGNLDFHTDLDYFLLDLNAGQRVAICADSFLLDAFISVYTEQEPVDSFASNDDDGGGYFDLNPEITYTAATTGTYIVAVSIPSISGGASNVGGYEIAVGSRCDDF